MQAIGAQQIELVISQLGFLGVYSPLSNRYDLLCCRCSALRKRAVANSLYEFLQMAWFLCPMLDRANKQFRGRDSGRIQRSDVGRDLRYG